MFFHHCHYYYYYDGFYVFPEDGFCSLAMWMLDGTPKGAHNQLACVEQTWLSVEVDLKNTQLKVEILFHSLPLGASHFWIAHLSMPAIKNLFIMNFCCYQVYNCEHGLCIFLIFFSKFFYTENLGKFVFPKILSNLFKFYTRKTLPYFSKNLPKFFCQENDKICQKEEEEITDCKWWYYITNLGK
jgi:hypothetical protein